MHIMLDLETLGTAPGCPILSIGAVSFCRSGVGVGVNNTFYCAVKLPENPTVSSETLLWWLDQSEEARHTLIDDQEAALGAEEALKAVSSWVKSTHLGVRFAGVWANGASFDLPIIESAMRDVGVDVPWPFYKHRCFRTMKTLPGADAGDVKPEFKGTAHNALDDAIHQAEWLINIHHKITPCL